MISKHKFACYRHPALSADTYRSHSEVSKPKQANKINPFHLDFKTSESVYVQAIFFLYLRSWKQKSRTEIINLDKEKRHDDTSLILITSNVN